MRLQVFGIISISDKVVHADILSTMACNPKRRIITDAFPSKQSAQNGADIYARDLQPKFEALRRMVYKGKLFGNTIACFKVTDF